MNKDYTTEYRIVTNGTYYKIQYIYIDYPTYDPTSLIINFFLTIFSKLFPKTYKKLEEENWKDINDYDNYKTLQEAQNYMDYLKTIRKPDDSNWIPVK